MSRYLFGSSPGGEAGPAPRVTAVSSDDEEPDWMRVLAAPTPAPAFPLPESSSDEPIMPVSKAAKPTPEETTQPAHAAAPTREAPTQAAAAPKSAKKARKSEPAGAAGGADQPGGKPTARDKATGPISSVPLLFPDRLTKGKVLVELDGEGDAVDLDGDIGAVGRLYTVGGVGPGSSVAERELRLDLKGVIYEARMLPCSSCMVVRIENQEAKVEAVMNQYMAVRRETVTFGEDGDLVDGFAFGDSSRSTGGGSGKRGRAASSGGAGTSAGDDDDDDGGHSGGDGMKKSKKPKAAKAKASKPKAKSKKRAKAKIKINR